MRTVFITGADKNTGLAIAEKFAQNGFHVAISSRSKHSADHTAQNLSKEYHIKAIGYQLDLTDINGIKTVFGLIKKDFGGLDTFVANSANLGFNSNMLAVQPSDYDDVMNVNLKGTYFCCQQAAQIMKEQNGGSIVIIGSVHYKAAIMGRSLYAASKGALASLTRAMAYELGKYNIRTNYIVAGAIKTDRWKSLSQEEIIEKRANWPIGLESTGEDIANAVFYLGTDLSKTVTGSDLTVDSGVLTCLLPYSKNQNNKDF